MAGDHLPRAVVQLPHERDVGEAVLSDRASKRLDRALVHGIGDVRRMAFDGVHGYLDDREALARLRALVEEPGDGEGTSDVLSRAHVAPRLLDRRSLLQGGFLARRR